VILYQQDVVKYDYSEGGSESEIFANLYFGVKETREFSVGV